MAFSDLDTLRASLNTELGITDGSTQPFGSSTDRNRYLQNAFRKMWPRMARLVRQSVTPTDTTMDYTLTAIRDVVRIDVLDSDGLVKDEIRSWELIVDESADPIVRRLLIPEMATSVTLRVTGYQPYKVPASGADTCDLPSELEHIPLAGARAEAYRARMTQYIDYEQRASENPTTATSGAEIMQLYLAAKQEFDELLVAHQRNITVARRAKRTVR